MPVERIHSFLVHPAKNAEEQPHISGTEVNGGGVQQMLFGLFDRAEQECKTPIVFRPDEHGRRLNECRDLIVAYVQHPTVPAGRRIATRLQQVSTNRSGLGLLFLVTGMAGREHKLVVSRFPADSGVIAEEQAGQLTVAFIERVFMKNDKAYKCALYRHASLQAGFRTGLVVDRQISGPQEVSEYWIGEFLSSDLETTGAAGTMRLGVALMVATRSATDLAVREELVAAARLLRNQDGRRRTTRQFMERIGLSDDAVRGLERAFPHGTLLDDPFEFDLEEFQKHVRYRSIELDNGGVMTAEEAQFEEVFQSEQVEGRVGELRYRTQGRIVDESLRKTK